VGSEGHLPYSHHIIAERLVRVCQCSIYLQEILPLLKQFSVILWLGNYMYHCVRFAASLMNLVFFSSVNFQHLVHNTCCPLVMRMPVSTVPYTSSTF